MTPDTYFDASTARRAGVASRRGLGVALLVCLLVSPAAGAAAGQPAPPPAPESTEPPPGVELARTLATATGIAITPLLGVGAVGAWQYYKADASVRQHLPWYGSPWFWAPALVVSLLLVFKDPLLGLIPGAKKPLDALDVLENKGSALLATPAVVPMFVGALSAAGATRLADGGGGVDVARMGMAELPGFLGDLPSAFGLTIGVLVFVAAFFCVWLAFHAINVLILLSPFGVLDMFLRSLKLVALVVLVGSTFVHPYLGLLVALVILAAAVPLAGWSFRLMVFGGVLAGDLLTMRHRREVVDAAGVRAFTVGRLGRARARTYGLVSVGRAGIRFSYRPWLVLPRRTVELAPGAYRLGRGVLCPIVRLAPDGDAPATVLRLPPRYRTHEEEIVSVLALAAVDDLPLLRGLKAAFAWLKEMAGRGGRQAARIAGQVREGLGA